MLQSLAYSSAACADPCPQGAIYVTSNGAMNWTAAVQETVDATLNRVISSGIRWGLLAGFSACGIGAMGLPTLHTPPVCCSGYEGSFSSLPDSALNPQTDMFYSLPRSGASYYEGSFSNISRNDAGEYVAVSSRGNFFMTWSPGGLAVFGYQSL